MSVAGNLGVGGSGYPTDYGVFKPGTGPMTISGNVTIYTVSVAGNNKIDSTGVNTPWTITGSISNSDTWIAGSSQISVGG